MVDRYDPELDSATWIKSDTGQVVFYEDYKALEARCNDWHKVADERSAEIIRLETKLAALNDLFNDVTRALADSDRRIAELSSKEEK